VKFAFAEITEFGTDNGVLEGNAQEIFDDFRFRKGASLFDLYLAETDLDGFPSDDDEWEELWDALTEGTPHKNLIGKRFVAYMTLEEMV
jgi:hypothetical protein